MTRTALQTLPAPNANGHDFIRATTLRDPNGISLTKAVRESFPAIFAKTPIEKMSDRYEFYPSYKLIDDMKKLDMKLVQVGQRSTKYRDPAGQLHVMRFQPNSAEGMIASKVGDSNVELVILNSHNGLNRFQAHAGVFRLVCLNGMVVSDVNLGSFAKKHFGGANSFDAIKALVDGLAQNTSKIGGRINAMQREMLDEAQQVALARSIMTTKAFPSWLEPEQLLIERRSAEATNRAGRRDLWTTYNVIQENVMKGDIDRTGEGRPSSTRGVTGAEQDVFMNVAMWDRLEAFTRSLDGGAPRSPRNAPKAQHEPEVEAKIDAAPVAARKPAAKKLETLAAIGAGDFDAPQKALLVLAQEDAVRRNPSAAAKALAKVSGSSPEDVQAEIDKDAGYRQDAEDALQIEKGETAEG